MRYNSKKSSSLEAHLSKAMTSFFRQTCVQTNEALALRATTLHMFESLAPRVFHKAGLGAHLQTAIQKLSAVPIAFDISLCPDEAMARGDAFYLLRLRGLQPQAPKQTALHTYLTHLQKSGHTLTSWLLGAMVHAKPSQVSQEVHFKQPSNLSLLEQLYWVTHCIFLESQFLREVHYDSTWKAVLGSLLPTVPWIIERGLADVGGEILLCLQCVGIDDQMIKNDLLDLLLDHQLADGAFYDAFYEANRCDARAHTTAVGLLVLAHEVEKAMES